ncbi:MAG: type II toxin-antitoxin system RelE/ParE family toxin [Candidatus Sulfotelmatobacter sp.]
MTELPAPERIAVIWSPEGRVDLRAIDRETAMQILHCVDRYLASRSGDVKKLKPPRTGFRLRCGDYRVFFDQKNDTTITITGVRHRRAAELHRLSRRSLQVLVGTCGQGYE